MTMNPATTGTQHDTGYLARQFDSCRRPVYLGSPGDAVFKWGNALHPSFVTGERTGLSR